VSDLEKYLCKAVISYLFETKDMRPSEVRRVLTPIFAEDVIDAAFEKVRPSGNASLTVEIVAGDERRIEVIG